MTDNDLHAEDEKALKRMIGTEGIADLRALCQLLKGEESVKAEPFSMAIGILYRGIENLKADLLEALDRKHTNTRKP